MPDTPDIPSPPPEELLEPAPPPRTRLGRFLLVAFINTTIPLCLLLIAELSLRHAGVGTDTHYLQRHTFDNTLYFSPNRAFFDQFSSLPMEQITNWDCMEWLARPEKSPDTFRVILFGESAVYGTPYPEYGFPRYLRAMLEVVYPDKKIEVINAACPGINTFTMQAVAHALCPALKPDACVIYAGNNEGCMPYAPTTFIGGHDGLARPAMVRAHIALLGLRLTQFGLAAMQRAGTIEDAPLAYAAGPPNETVLSHYRSNLVDMAASAFAGGAKVYLCTLGRNTGLKDAPVDTFNGVPLNRAEPFPLPYNVIARQLTREDSRIVLADVEEDLRKSCGEGYSPAYNFFTDLVHLNFEGDYVAAKTVLSAMVRDVSLFNAELLQPSCENRIGLSPATKARLTESLLKGMDPNDNEAARQWVNRYRAMETPTEITALRKALDGAPDDPILYTALYGAYSLAGEYQKALEAAQEYQRRFPIRRGAHALRAEALFLKDFIDDARKEALLELESYPDDIRAHRVLRRIAEREEEKQKGSGTP